MCRNGLKRRINKMVSTAIESTIITKRSALKQTEAEYRTVKSMIRFMSGLLNKTLKEQKVELRKQIEVLKNELQNDEAKFVKETGARRRGRPRIHFNNEVKSEKNKQPKLVRKATKETKAKAPKVKKAG